MSVLGADGAIPGKYLSPSSAGPSARPVSRTLRSYGARQRFRESLAVLVQTMALPVFVTPMARAVEQNAPGVTNAPDALLLGLGVGVGLTGVGVEAGALGVLGEVGGLGADGWGVGVREVVFGAAGGATVGGTGAAA